MFVKPIFAVLFNKNYADRFEKVLELLKEIAGDFDLVSDTFHFPHLENYYAKEMGKPLLKVFLSSESLIEADPCSEELNPVKLKLLSMEIEKEFSINGKRMVNIDPGWLDKYHLFLTTRKERGGRFYLGRGVFAEMEYLYFGGEFRELFWTYADYGRREVKDFFLKVRKLYLKRLRELGD